MLPRHLIPLALGLAAFVVAQATREAPRADTAGFSVSCAGGRVEIAATGGERFPNTPPSCVIERFPDRAAAERFIRDGFGTTGAACGCD